jgi:uncharacterized phage protein (TIGR02216 family)
MTPAAAQPFPWDEVLAFALGVLRWSPEVMWAATPREIAAAASAMAPNHGAPALDSASLNALMQLYPDDDGESQHHADVPGYST